MQSLLPQKLLLIGTGMIGVSLALSLKKACPSIHIIGWDINAEYSKMALALGAIDTHWSGSLSQALETHDTMRNALETIVIAVPLTAYASVFQTISPRISSDVLITDVGSCKSFVIEVAQRFFPDTMMRFIPGHPIAGCEQSGPQAARVGLFHEHRLILTPLPEHSKHTVARIRALWESVGAYVEEMSAAQHDHICAMISHMPHLLSFVLVYDVLRQPNGKNYLPYAAGGFRDFTRIAASDPQMWHDIFLSNKPILLEQLDHFQQSLSSFRQMLEPSIENASPTHMDLGKIQPSPLLLEALQRASECRKSLVKRPKKGKVDVN